MFTLLDRRPRSSKKMVNGESQNIRDSSRSKPNSHGYGIDITPLLILELAIIWEESILALARSTLCQFSIDRIELDFGCDRRNSTSENPTSFAAVTRMWHRSKFQMAADS